MRVKCTHIYNEITKEFEEKCSWITIGKEYIVLAIEVRKDEVSFLINSDSNEKPVLENAKQFEVLSKKIPSSWEVIAGDIELLTIGPKVWQEPGFWDRCYEHDPLAKEIYRQEVRIIIDEENN